jgi:hypothetical protein
MTVGPPVLLLGFNRPEKMSQLISALSVSKPGLILIAVDGPRMHNSTDVDLVRKTQETASLVTWPATVIPRFRNANLGLRDAVVDAVSWATSEYGRVIVIEDDCVPGPDFLTFATNMLERFKDEPRIAHVNGYNLVAPNNLQDPSSPIRLTRYPESYAWATWERAWSHYDNDLSWATQCPVQELHKITHSYLGALRGKINFADAKSERIQTWAYRWLASMWKNNLTIIAPNANLVHYDGHDDGTHTRRKARWTELPVTGDFVSSPDQAFDFQNSDELADRWIGQNVFRENALGIVEGLAASVAMELLKRRQENKRKGSN